MCMLLLAADDAVMQDVFAPAWLPAITSIVVFLVAFGFLYLKVWPMITGGLDARENKIREEIAAAEESRKQARAALAEYEENLAKAREEATQMIARARADAKATSEELRKRNEEELTAMKERATRDIEAAKRNAIGEIHAEAASLATSIAARILEREVSTEDQQRLVEQSLQELNAARTN